MNDSLALCSVYVQDTAIESTYSNWRTLLRMPRSERPKGVAPPTPSTKHTSGGSSHRATSAPSRRGWSPSRGPRSSGSDERGFNLSSIMNGARTRRRRDHTHHHGNREGAGSTPRHQSQDAEEGTHVPVLDGHDPPAAPATKYSSSPPDTEEVPMVRNFPAQPTEVADAILSTPAPPRGAVRVELLLGVVVATDADATDRSVVRIGVHDANVWCNPHDVRDEKQAAAAALCATIVRKSIRNAIATGTLGSVRGIAVHLTEGPDDRFATARNALVEARRVAMDTIIDARESAQFDARRVLRIGRLTTEERDQHDHVPAVAAELVDDLVDTMNRVLVASERGPVSANVNSKMVA